MKKMKACKVKGCKSKKRMVNGYCSRHYQQLRRFGEILKRTKFDPNEIIIKTEIAEVILYNVKHQEVARAIIDIEDIEKVKKYKWRLGNGYAVTFYKQCNEKWKSIRMQHVVLGIYPDKKKLIDHIDRDRLNNRKYNFRFCTNKENVRNAKLSKANTSGYKGVSWQKNRKNWAAAIRVDNKTIHLGVFKTRIRAAKVYNMAAKKHFGEFANLNEL